jgi:hypothetical protein
MRIEARFMQHWRGKTAMPFYRVLVRQDAWINHEGYVEASSADQAAEFGVAAWQGRKKLDVPLRPTGECEGFDAAICEPDDCEEIEREELQGEVELHKQIRESPAAS